MSELVRWVLAALNGFCAVWKFAKNQNFSPNGLVSGWPPVSSSGRCAIALPPENASAVTQVAASALHRVCMRSPSRADVSGRVPTPAIAREPSSCRSHGAAVDRLPGVPSPSREVAVAESVYRVTEVIGVSSESWEAAAKAAVVTAAKTVRDLRIAEVLRQDLTIENGQVTGYRVRLGISFKYESGD